MNEGGRPGSSSDDELVRLIEEVNSGRSAAFAGIVRRYQRKVFGMALSFTRNRASAEDLTQEIFLAVFQSLPRFDVHRSFTNWILRIAHNHCCKALRKKQPLPSDTIEAIVAFDPIAEHIKQEERDAILMAFHALNEDFRLVVWLFYFLDRNLNQIAEILEISVNLAKVRLFRARQAMAKHLAVTSAANAEKAATQS